MRKLHGLGADIDGVMGKKQGLVANYALLTSDTGTNRISENIRFRIRGERDSSRC